MTNQYLIIVYEGTHIPNNIVRRRGGILGHHRFGHKNAEATNSLIITVEMIEYTDEIKRYLTECGAYGYIESDLGLTAILIKCKNRDSIAKGIEERWGHLRSLKIK